MDFELRTAPPSLRDDGLPPKVYYRLTEAAEILRCSPESLLHYGGTGRIALVTPIPWHLIAKAINEITNETFPPFDSPELLVLSVRHCRCLEYHGHAIFSSCSVGYEIWGSYAKRCEAQWVHSNNEEPSLAATRGWQYILVPDWDTHSGEEITIHPSDLWVMAEEIDRFRTSPAENDSNKKESVDLERLGHDAARNHNRSEKLAAINQAYWRFWANADREDRMTHPANKDVAAWLLKRGYSATLADQAATIIRPEWAPTGRKPEE